MIYRKGEGQMNDEGKHTGLINKAVEQRIARESERRDIGTAAQNTRDYERGITTARYLTDLGHSADLNELSPKELGPVSGSEMATYKAKKSAASRTTAREMKRR
jgi:hypothetical protein